MTGSQALSEGFARLDALLLHLQRRIHRKLEEVLMSTPANDTQLTQAVADLTASFDANVAAIAAEIAFLKNATAADDPAITDSVGKIEAIVTQLEAATAAATAAVTPAPAPPATT